MDTKVIEVSRLRKSYGSHVAVRDVSFAVERGEIFGIVGPNGAGKTSTVECIEGLRIADAGSIRVLGLDPVADAAAMRRRVGAQLQESQLPAKMRVGEALSLYASFYADPADCSALLEALGLADKTKRSFEQLSGGEKQRLSVALALVGNPEVAILDELTTGLDPHARRDMWQLIEDIRARGVTIVLVTHFMEEAERLCDRIAVFDAGQIVAVDTPAGLVSRVNSDQYIRFRTDEPFDLALLSMLPEVTSVSRTGSETVVGGTENALNAVVSVLARHEILAKGLHVEQMTLDDAFLALTADHAAGHSGHQHGVTR